MSLKIEKLGKDGDAEKEFVRFKATADLNLHDYAVVDRTFDADGNVSNVFRHTYRFPDKNIKKGELVSLRTGKGDYELTTITGNIPLHRFFWDACAPVWNDANAESVEVWKVATVDSKTTGNLSSKKGTSSLRPNNLKHGGNK